MAAEGRQNYNAELLKSIEDVREKREELTRQIEKDEANKVEIQNELSILTDRLTKLNENLARKIQTRNEYNKIIQETEAAYIKILESSQTLLDVLKRESHSLDKKTPGYTSPPSQMLSSQEILPINEDGRSHVIPGLLGVACFMFLLWMISLKKFLRSRKPKPLMLT